MKKAAAFILALLVAPAWGQEAGVFRQGDTRNAAHAGKLILAVRNDAGGTLNADGKYTPLQVDGQGALRVTFPSNASINVGQVAGTATDTNSGNKSAGTQRVVIATDQPNFSTALNVNCVAGCSAGGSFADAAAFTFGTTAVSNTSFVVDDVATNTVAENSAGAGRMSTNRIPYFSLHTDAGVAVPFPAALGANGGLKIEGVASGTVVPVSGTVTVTDGAGALNVIVDSGSITTVPPSNASTNVAQLAGTATSVNSGVKDAGTLRVVLATDQPALTNKLLVTPDSVALPANQSVNVAQMGGIATSMNTGVRDTGTQRVTVATNDLVPVSAASLPLPTGASTLTEQQTQTTALQLIDNLPLAQGSTTSGQSGVLTQGAVTTAAPAYTTAQTDPLSLTTAGGLRSDVASYGGTATTLGQKAMAASVPVTLSSDYFEPEVTISGTISAVCTDPCATGSETSSNTVKLVLSGKQGGINIDFPSSNLVGTLKCESSGNNADWVLLNCLNVLTGLRGGSIVNPAAKFPYSPNITPGMGWFRIRASAYTSGSATIDLRANNVDSYNTILPVSSWPGDGVTATKVSQRIVNIGGGDGTAGCDGVPCTQRAVFMASPPSDVGPATTQTTIAQTALVTRNIAVATATGALTAVCADPCQGAGAVSTSQVAIELGAETSFAVALTAVSAATMTIKFEGSFDNNDWFTLTTVDGSNGFRASSFANPASPPKRYAPGTLEGIRYGRVRCSAFTSGSATFRVVATNTQIDPVSYLGIAGTQIPGSGPQMMVSDGSTGCNGAACSRVPVAANTTPVGTEWGLIVRSTDGKAEDAAHTSGDVGGFSLGVRKDTNTQVTSADAEYAQFSVDAYGAAFSRVDNPNRIECTADNIGATLTQLTGCGVPGAGLSIYVTDIIAQSTTATAGAMTLKVGTGANCGTGTAFFYPPVAGTSIALGNASTSGPLRLNFNTPRKIAANTALCVLGVVTNTTNILVLGWIAP